MQAPNLGCKSAQNEIGDRIDRLRQEISNTERKRACIDSALKTRRETLRRWEAKRVLDQGLSGPPTPQMSEPGFIKLQRTPETKALLADGNAFRLLTVIAFRARFSDEANLEGLGFGEALIGDHDTYGMTRQQERSARNRLTKWGLARFACTNRGTIATLLDSRVYSLRNERKSQKNNQPDNPLILGEKPKEPTSESTKGQPAANQQATTNQNDKNEFFLSEKSERRGIAAKLAADPRHHEITSQWGQRFQSVHGFPYASKGSRDGKALKELLPSIKETAAEFLSIAESAWKRAMADSYASFCRKAAAIDGLCRNFNEVRSELQRPHQKSKQVPTAHTDPAPRKVSAA